MKFLLIFLVVLAVTLAQDDHCHQEDASTCSCNSDEKAVCVHEHCVCAPACKQATDCDTFCAHAPNHGHDHPQPESHCMDGFCMCGHVGGGPGGHHGP